MKKVFIAALTVLFVGLCLTSCEQKQSGTNVPIEGIQKSMLLGTWQVIEAYRTENGIKVENHDVGDAGYWIFYDNIVNQGGGEYLRICNRWQYNNICRGRPYGSYGANRNSFNLL